MVLQSSAFQALLIGVDTYLHPRVAHLPATLHDVQALGKILTDPARCGYMPSNVWILTGAQATARKVREAFRSLAGTTTYNSTVLIYFSGHGGRAREGNRWRTYLCLHDADPDNLAQTAISGDELSEFLASLSVSKMVVILDACHAAGSANWKASDGTVIWKAGLPEVYLEALSQGSGRVVIASCREDQFSYIRREGDMSLFTYHLVQALQGEAAVRGDGLVHVLDVFHYVNEEVRNQEPRQTPVLKVTDLDLNFPIALAPRSPSPFAPPIFPGIAIIREQIIHSPLAGSRSLSEYLKSHPEMQELWNEVDLKRSELERIQHDLDLFGPDPALQAAKNRAIYFLLRVCRDLERGATS